MRLRAADWCAPALCLVLSLFTPLAAASHAALLEQETPAPAELFEVVKVVDGDTIHIERNGEVQKLRLLSVDTEERIWGNANASATKPETTFGEECALWAQEFFDGLTEDDAPPQIGVRFPDGEERFDVYGRLLCHVILPDGRDFNLLLVELGKSPYFNKYGNSLICHDLFVAAQRNARAKKLGIWNPATNAAATAGAPEAKRPYDQLLPWWQARATAIDDFRAKHAADPEKVVEAENVKAMAAAAQREDAVLVFGTPYRLFDEDSGDWTVLFRATDRDRAFRVRIREEHRAAFAAISIEDTVEEFHQNYVWVLGRVVDSGRGFEIWCDEPDMWSLAGPEPAIPEPAHAGN